MGSECDMYVFEIYPRYKMNESVSNFMKNKILKKHRLKKPPKTIK